IDVDLQVYFLDANYVRKDSLFTGSDQFVKSGQLDAAGKVVAAAKTVKDIVANNEKMKIISSSKYIVIRASLQTKDARAGREVKIYSDYYLKVQMGVKAELSYKP
ncbi:MAG: hypothetical protein V4616_01120, partial [Bacteroidota bacterium]